MKKVQKTDNSYNWRTLRQTFSTKNKKLPQNTQNPKIQKNKKVMWGGLKSKSSENQLSLEWTDIQNYIFKNFKNSKITPTNTQKPKIQKV